MKAILLVVAVLLVGLGRGNATPPPNDSFATATVMAGSYWLASGTLFGATSEANEPILTGYPNGPTAWWRWKAPASGLVRVRTWGSEADNMLGVYRGATLDATRLIAHGSSHYERANSAEVQFSAAAGETYSIQVLGADYASPIFISDPFLPSRLQLSLTYRTAEAPPANDRFDQAQVLSGASADVVVNLTGAVKEPGEPVDQPDAQGNTVWLAWTAPSSGGWQIDAQQGDFDNLLTVYTGSTVSTLTRLDSADQDYSFDGNPFVGGGRVTFGAVAGQTYRFQVQGAALAGAPFEYGNVRLLLQPVQPPANDDFGAAAVLTGANLTADGYTTFAFREVGEPPAKMDETRSIWWRWVAPVSGVVAVIQHEGTVDAYAGTTLPSLTRQPYGPNPGGRNSLGGVTDWYSATAGSTVWLRGTGLGDRVVFSLRVVQPPANDDFASRKPLVGAVVGDAVDTEYASWERDEPQTDGFGPQTVWYRWVAPSTRRFVIATEGSPSFTRVAVYTGDSLATLTRAGTEALAGYAPSAYGRVFLEAVAGTEYAITLRRESVVTGVDHLGIRPASPPANDAFAAATAVVGSAWTGLGSNVDATSEPSEPFTSLSDGPSGASVWWRWIAPLDGVYRVSTAGSGINTVLVVYSGTSLGSLTRVAQNQDAGWGSSGAVTFLASAGTSYSFQVDGQGREQGALKLTLAPTTPPPNDAFANRLPLSGTTAVAGGTVLGATIQPGEPPIPGATGGHSVWYEWTAPASGSAFFQVTAARFSPAFGLYQGDLLASLQPGITGGSGSAAAGEQTFLSSYPVSSGTRYKIRVDGAPLDNGDFRLSVTMPAPPVNDAFAARSIVSGAVVHSSADNTGATSQAGEPAHAGSSARFSVWWEWTAPRSGPVSIDTLGSTAQARLAVYTGTAVNALVPVGSGPITFPPGFSRVTFPATAGTRYVIAADSGERSRGEIALNIVASSGVPPNDTLAAATTWAADQAEALVRPVGASAEAGEPAHGGRPAARSLWWAWTPRTTRRAMVWMETEKEALLARVALYKGSALNDLVAVASFSTDVRWGRLEVDVLAGETYYLALDTAALAADPGWIKLGVVPPNGTRANAAALSPTDGFVTASTQGASNEDPVLAPSSLRQLWWVWVADVNARMEWRALAESGGDVDISVGSTGAFFGSVANATSGRVVPGSGEVVGTFDAVAGNAYFLKVVTRAPRTVTVRLVEAPRQVPPANDQQYLAQVMAGGAWSVPLTLGAESGDRQWWKWTAPSAGVVQVQLTGTLAADDALLAYADGGLAMTAAASHTDGGPPVLRLGSAAGQQWVFATRSHLRRLRPAVLSLVSPAPGVAPAHDSWTNPQILPAAWDRVTGDVTLASCQPGEPDHSASGGTHSATPLPPGRSVWYQWTPAADGWVVLRLDSSAPLAMQVYRGRTLEEFQPMGVLLPDSRVLRVYLLAGQAYHIAIATRPYDERTGSFTLSRGAAAPNDMLAAATALAGASASGSADSEGATLEPGEPGHGFSFETPRASLWWKWTAPATGLVWIDTRGSEFDTILAVFASDPPDGTARVAENQNATPQTGVNVSAAVFTAVSGQAYFVRVCRGETTAPVGIARVHLSMTPLLDPYARWVADFPTLVGATGAEMADPDGDGLPNLAELAFGGNPLAPDASRGALRILPAEGGVAVEATIDRGALAALYGGTALELEWQLSRDLRQWQPGPAPQTSGQDGRLSVERILLTPEDPPFARLVVRRLR